MNSYRRPLLHAVQALLCVGVIASSALAAAAPVAVEGRADAKPSRAACPYGTTTPASTKCLTKADIKEPGSESAGSEREPDRLLRNALLRCERLEGDDRKDCQLRIKGQGVSSGSVEGGGILRELVTREVATPKATAAEVAAPVVAPK